MNLLYLANVVVAEVGEDYYWHWTHDQEIGKALVAACATVIAALIAITGVILTVRKTTQQIELSKQGTPPELTRYKEWLEVSEKYKEFVNLENVDELSIDPEEYREIEASRKASLERATWERKVLSACPDIRAQKRILNIPHAMSTAEKIDFFALWPWFKSRLVKILENIFAILMTALIFVELIEYLWKPISMQSAFSDVFVVFLIGYVFSMLLSIYAADSGEMDAEYYFIRLHSAETEVNEEETIKSFSRYFPNMRRVRLAYLKSEYRNWIYYPGYSLQGRRLLHFFIPVILFFYYFLPFYWILCFVSWVRYGEWKMYGTYRPGAFGLDEEKSKRFSWAKLLKSIKELEFNDKKVCVLWLIMVAVVIAIGTLTGGKQIINILVFNIGYVISFFLISMNEKVLNKLSDGPSSEFQKKVSSCAVILLFVLMALLGSLFFATENWRLIWLGALMVGALYFFPYYFVHGKSMIYLGLICAINIFVGYVCTDISLEVIAYIDTAIKFMFGIYLLFLSKPSKQV